MVMDDFEVLLRQALHSVDDQDAPVPLLAVARRHGRRRRSTTLACTSLLVVAGLAGGATALAASGGPDGSQTARVAATPSRPSAPSAVSSAPTAGSGTTNCIPTMTFTTGLEQVPVGGCAGLLTGAAPTMTVHVGQSISVRIPTNPDGSPTQVLPQSSAPSVVVLTANNATSGTYLARSTGTTTLLERTANCTLSNGVCPALVVRVIE